MTRTSSFGFQSLKIIPFHLTPNPLFWLCHLIESQEIKTSIKVFSGCGNLDQVANPNSKLAITSLENYERSTWIKPAIVEQNCLPSCMTRFLFLLSKVSQYILQQIWDRSFLKHVILTRTSISDELVIVQLFTVFFWYLLCLADISDTFIVH